MPDHNIYHVSYRQQTDAERVMESLTQGERLIWEACPGCGIGCARLHGFTVAACSLSACRAKMDSRGTTISFDSIIANAAKTQRRLID